MRQTLLWFREEDIALPALRPDATWGDEIIWRPPVYTTVLHILRNPCYAGTYAFGRTATRTQVRDGLAHKTRGHHRAREEWIVLLRDHHEPYISWEVYERHQTLIAENAAMKGLMRRGAVRRGPSLLTGLLRCGHCGRRLHVTYSGSTGRVPRYSCCDGRVNHGAARCISFGGARVDAAVEQELLRVLAPGAIGAALASADETAGETAAVRRALELELREAQYEAERARRQYDAVEPEHRLVAVTLEERWNAALERVRTLEQRRTAVAAEAARTSGPDRATLLRLAEEFPAVWADPATDLKTKKQLVRLLVEEIIVRVPEEPVVELVIHWKGGKHTALRVRRNRRGQHGRTTNREIVDVVRELARCQPDGQIARLLNRLGYRTGAGNGWTESRVRRFSRREAGRHVGGSRPGDAPTRFEVADAPPPPECPENLRPADS